MATIKVRRPPKAAFNPQRKASDLLKKLIEHLEWAVRPASERKPGQLRRIKPVRTEADAAARVEALMRRLPSAPYLPLPPGEVAAAPTPRRAVKRARAAVARRPRRSVAPRAGKVR